MLKFNKTKIIVFLIKKIEWVIVESDRRASFWPPRDINYLLKVKTRNGRWEPGNTKRCNLCTGEDISADSIQISRSVMSDSSRPHGLQPIRLLHPWDFPGKSTGVGCHCLLRNGMLLNHKKEFNHAICSNMDGSRDYHTISEVRQRKLILSGITYMWNLIYDTNELIYKTETVSQT